MRQHNACKHSTKTAIRTVQISVTFDKTNQCIQLLAKAHTISNYITLIRIRHYSNGVYAQMFLYRCQGVWTTVKPMPNFGIFVIKFNLTPKRKQFSSSNQSLPSSATGAWPNFVKPKLASNKQKVTYKPATMPSPKQTKWEGASRKWGAR